MPRLHVALVDELEAADIEPSFPNEDADVHEHLRADYDPF